MAAYKPYILTVTILAVIGAIFFLNSSNAKRGGGGEITPFNDWNTASVHQKQPPPNTVI